MTNERPMNYGENGKKLYMKNKLNIYKDNLEIKDIEH